MNIDTLAVGFVIDPVSFIDIAIYVSELAEAMCSIVLPRALITSAISPNLSTLPISETAEPLSRVLRTSRVCVGGPLFSLGMWIIRLV